MSSERLKVHVERSFGLQCNFYNHHVVQDGIQLFNLQKGKDGSLCPESFKIVHCTISKLSNEALQSVANIATHNRISFEKIRPRMKKIIKDHLPKYLTELDNENTKSQLSEILTNPYSYQSNSVRLATPVSPILLSSINQALDGLNEMPEQALVAMNRKLREKSCPPRFLHVAQASTKSHLVSMIWKRCGKIISELEEGNYLPKKLAKALSVMNLYRKLTLRCMDISQSEFFPFSRGTMSLQNDVLNALWSLPKVNHNDLKLLRPMLGQGSKVEKTFFKVALRRYLIECLFECDEGNLPDVALRTIAFLIRMSPKRQQVILTEERKEEEVEAVLDLSSRLTSLARCGTEGCPSDDEVSLGSDKCSEDNDFVLTETNYFNFGSQQQMDERCCSNIMTNTADMSGTFRGINYVPDSDSQLGDVLSRICERIEDFGGAGHYRDSKAAGSMMEPHSKKVVGANNVKMTRCSEDLTVICDETASVAHKLVGQILKNMLLAENNEVDELTRGYLEGGSISQGPQALVAEENQEANIVIQAVQDLLPNMSESCVDKVRRILHGGEQ